MNPTPADRPEPRDDSLQGLYLGLATDWTLWQEPLEAALRRITRTLATAIGVRRSSFWLIDDSGSLMRTLVLFDAVRGHASEPGVIFREDCPAYFDALGAGRVVDAHDALADQRTHQMAPEYLRPTGVGALLDATVRTAGRTTAVMSVENVGGPRLWSDAERCVVVSMADLAAQLLVHDGMRRSEARYRTLLDNMPAAAYRCTWAGEWVAEYVSGGAAMVLEGVITNVTDRRRAAESARHEHDLVLRIAEGTAGETGDRFLDRLTSELARAMGTDFCFVAELDGERPGVVRTVSVFARGERAASFEYTLPGTPCADVLDGGICFHPSGVQSLYPEDALLVDMGIESYLGAPLKDSEGRPIGLLAVLHGAPYPADGFAETLFRISAARAAAELERRNREVALQRSQEQLLARNESLAMVNMIAGRLHAGLDAASIARETVEALKACGAPDVVAFYRFDPASRRLRLVTFSGEVNDSVRDAGRDLPVEGSLSGLALLSGQVMVSEEVGADQRISPPAREALARMGMRCAVVVPLAYAGEPLGTITLAWHRARQFNAHEATAVASTGAAVSLALAGARQMADLEHQAHHDALTGLPNRVLLHREFERIVAAGEKSSAVPALMLLDLNRFKEINDTLGHHVGDRLLQQVGPRMCEALAGEQALVCRLGGDEFAVLASGLAGASDAVTLAQRVLDALRRPFDAGGMRLEVGASVGVAAWPAHGRDSHELLRCADVAMYEAKRSGAGVVLYDAAFDQHTPQRLALVQDLGEAIRSNQLLLHFQPKVRLADGAVTGFEALLRWQHPRLGLLAPGAFIPLAEVGDLMQSVTQCVVELGLARCRAWRDAGLPHTLAINLSPRNLLERDFLERFETALRESGADPSQLELELTETALMQDPDGAAGRLRRIAALGVRVSIDDFGTGYSSLAHLRRLPIHALKIDRMFVKDLLSSAQDEAIVRATIGLAHNLGLEVIAEGVESAPVRDALQAMGCDQIQGYLLSPPLPWEEAAAWLAGRAG